MALENPFAGPLYLLRGFGLIFKPGLRPFVAVPLLLNTLLFAGLVWYGVTEMEALGTWVDAQVPSWLGWLHWLLWPLFVIGVVLILFYTFTLVANVIGAPFNGLLAEKVEYLLTGRSLEQGGTWRDVLKGALPAMLVALRKALRGLLWAIPFLVLFVIPVVNVLAPFLWLAYSAWMLAAEYLDYPMDNHGVAYREQLKLRRGRFFTSLGFGGATLVATLIPVVNFLVMPAAVAGATALWVDKYAARAQTGA